MSFHGIPGRDVVGEIILPRHRNCFYLSVNARLRIIRHSSSRLMHFLPSYPARRPRSSVRQKGGHPETILLPRQKSKDTDTDTKWIRL